MWCYVVIVESFWGLDGSCHWFFFELKSIHKYFPRLKKIPHWADPSYTIRLVLCTSVYEPEMKSLSMRKRPGKWAIVLSRLLGVDHGHQMVSYCLAIPLNKLRWFHHIWPLVPLLKFCLIFCHLFLVDFPDSGRLKTWSLANELILQHLPWWKVIVTWTQTDP